LILAERGGVVQCEARNAMRDCEVAWKSLLSVFLCFHVANKGIKRGWPADDMAALAAMRPILQTRNR
jgi:hypothetical protein